MRERLVGSVVVALLALLAIWIVALIWLASGVVPLPFAIGAAVVVGLVAFGIDTLLSRRG